MGWVRMQATAARSEPGRRVLVVEDEHAVCELMSDLLAELGLETVCVSTDKDAYALLTTLPTLSALVLDVNLGPGTTGFDIARFARQVIPNVAVIYVSGQASPQSFRAFGVPDSGFVRKPFTPEELLDAVRARIPAQE